MRRVGRESDEGIFKGGGGVENILAKVKFWTIKVNMGDDELSGTGLCIIYYDK